MTSVVQRRQKEPGEDGKEKWAAEDEVLADGLVEEDGQKDLFTALLAGVQTFKSMAPRDFRITKTKDFWIKMKDSNFTNLE